jgi:hypothetical protein
MALSVSVDGGDRVPAASVVLFDEGTPIAAAVQHGNIVIYADSVRDREDLVKILDQLGIRAAPAIASGLVIKGTSGF